MVKHLRHFAFYTLAFIMLYLAGVRTPHAAENPALLTDMEEYTVLAAVLSPKEDAATTQKSDPYTRPARLDGITGNYYILSCFTTEGTTKTGKASDREMTDDYNRRNRQPYRIDKKRLRSLIQEDVRIDLTDPDEGKSTEEGVVSSSETTYISRPGFNKDKTRAIVQINQVADPEMGVGYIVYLEKAPSTGTWTIVAFDLNRMY